MTKPKILEPDRRDVEEIVQCGLRKANFYLANGYRLLSMQGERELRHKEEAKQWYIWQHVVYILGRPADVEAVTPPTWEELKARQAEESD